MSSQSSFASEVLENSASVLAAFSANLLLEREPAARGRVGGDALRTWKSHLTQRTLELAAALSVGEPRVFVDRVAWDRKAFQAREVLAQDLRASLEALRDVLQAELPEAARDEPARYLSLALESFEGDAPETRGLDPQNPEEKLALTYLLTILEGDTRGAMDLVVAAVDGGLQAREAYIRVMLPALREVGQMWHMGETSIAEEHLVTDTTRRLMSILSRRLPRQASNNKTVVAAAVAGNTHEIAIRALSDFFEAAGWRSICLGADVPSSEVISAVQFFGADLLALSAVLTTQFAVVRETVELLRAQPDLDVPVLVGGSAFAGTPDLVHKLGANAHAASFEQALPSAARLVGLDPTTPEA